MSSSTQKDRPWVDTTRSPRWTFMSVMGVAGRFPRRRCQPAPSSKETKTPNSVPAKRSPFRSGSSRTTRTQWSWGIPLVPSVRRAHVAPKSSVRHT